MKQSRFTDEQIIGFLKQADAGMSVKELCRSGGFSQPTFYKWRSRFGGMEPSDAAKLRELEAENNKLKKLLPKVVVDFDNVSILHYRLRHQALERLEFLGRYQVLQIEFQFHNPNHYLLVQSTIQSRRYPSIRKRMWSIRIQRAHR